MTEQQALELVEILRRLNIVADAWDDDVTAALPGGLVLCASGSLAGDGTWVVRYNRVRGWEAVHDTVA